MAQDTATMDAIHKANSAQIVAQTASNAAAAAALTPNVGHTEPPVSPSYMQGTTSGVRPRAFTLNRA